MNEADEREEFFAEVAPPKAPPQSFGRYVLHHPIARGGMARVYAARLVGAEGFHRLVAAKRLHPQFTDDPDFVTMFHDEARIASRIHHPNVVPVLDVVVEGREVILVQEYVHGVPLDKLVKATLVSDAPIPVPIVIAIVAGVLSGLHAAHEATDEADRPLDIVHRDVSPQNIMVSVDGVPRLLDFGIARASSSAHVTREGMFKGKLAYMAPEQLRAENVTRTADVYAAGVLLWELLAHRRLHSAKGEARIFAAVLSGELPKLVDAMSEERPSIDAERRARAMELEPIVSRALAPRAEQRFPTAADMMAALLGACPAATPMDVATWVKTVGAEYLDQRQKVLAASEESWRSQSKIAITSDMPVSRDISVVKQTAGTFDPPAWPLGGADAPPPERPPIRMRIAWVAAGAMLVMSGAFAGVLAAGGDETPMVLARSLALPPVAIAAPDPPPVAPTPPPTMTRPPPVFIVQSPTMTSPPSPPSPPRVPAPRAVASPPVRDFPIATASHSTAPPPPPKPDCDPPFYYDGPKKLYKPGCL